MYTKVSKHFMLFKDAEKPIIKPILSVCLTLGLIGTSCQLTAAEPEEPQERWFEIEVILYKEISDKGLTNESWDTDTPFNLPEELKDFLNPIAPADSNQELNEKINELKSNQIELQTSSDRANALATQGGSNKSNETQVSSEQAFEPVNTSQSDELQEQPFVPLEQDVLELQKEAKNISVHPSFRLLAHFGWRQPVAGKSSAVPVRFAGGHDYSEQFDFNGTKKLELQGQQQLLEPLTEIMPSLEAEPVVSEVASDQSTNENKLIQQSITQDAQQEDKNIETMSKDSGDSNEPILLPWVPEIDGSAKVYIYRNYLHLDADLVFRKPGQLEVDIYSLDSPLKFENDPLVTPIVPMSDDFNSLNDSSSKDSSRSEFESPNQTDAFAWQFDSDFLSQDSEKVFTEKLFNYPLKQTRRMRSTELHYFDHPKVGMLVVIRPYEIETNEESINE